MGARALGRLQLRTTAHGVAERTAKGGCLRSCHRNASVKLQRRLRVDFENIYNFTFMASQICLGVRFVAAV